MRLAFTTLQGEDVSIRVSEAEFAQMLERFTVRGARQEIECPICERYTDSLGDTDCVRCPLNFCCDIVPHMRDADFALLRVVSERHGVHASSTATLRKFRRLIRRAAARGRK